MIKKHEGKCALCKKDCTLTFEHIPPRGALNNVPVKNYSGNESFKLLAGENGRKPWDVDGLKYNNQQQGQGLYSLCESCNNITGTWYGEEYNEFAINAHISLVKCTPQIVPNTLIEFFDVNFYPLRFIKQVVSMFLSLNNGCFDDSLRDFVLNKYSNVYNKDKYRLFMYLVCGGCQKLVPFTVMRNVFTQSSLGLSEITTYPLGFVLVIDPSDNMEIPCVDITEFCNYQYDEKATFDFGVPIYESNTLCPLDFRLKAEVESQAQQNKNKFEMEKNNE